MLLSLSHPPPPPPSKSIAASHSTPSAPPPPPPPSKSSLRFRRNPKPPKPQRIRTPSSPQHETLAKSSIQRIAEKLRSLGYLTDDDAPGAGAGAGAETGPGSPGEIFIPTPGEIPKYRVGCTLDSSWSSPDRPVPEPGSGTTITRFRELWRREKDTAAEALKPEENVPVPTAAELTLPPVELRRLRSEGIRLEKRLKVGKAGITEGIVNGIHERWRRSELVKIKCEDLCRMNMKRTHEILERKTGGLVVWRSGSIIVLYRGANYKYPYYFDQDYNKEVSDESSLESDADDIAKDNDTDKTHTLMLYANPPAKSAVVIGVGSPNKVRPRLEGEAQLEEEADRLLDGLGPRFVDWWGYSPLPVDADLLSPLVPGFRKPFRLLPFGIKPKLTDREMTILRRLSKPLPCHFALGRNRNLQGLAVSMIKLWEKCEVAKIAIKRGVQNTNNDIIADELKQLTGGTLLSKDKEFIVFYRGKDFLPPAVSVALEHRRNHGFDSQKRNVYEKHPDADAIVDNSESKLVRDIPADESKHEAAQKRSSIVEARFPSMNPTLERLENKLLQAIEKKENAERLLEELEKDVDPKVEPDKEAITQEERYMLRKIGLRMKPFLLLGRRGVFDGTVENMHLHWKYRELVKIISKEHCIKDVEEEARTLEAESGGILVAVERVSKGHAIIMYRGKNYQRPSNLRPETLLSKKEAMKRSLEAQRRESLKLHVLNLSSKIDQLKHQMVTGDAILDAMPSHVMERNGASAEMSHKNGSSAGESKDSAEVEEVHVAALESSHLDNNCGIKEIVSAAPNQTENDKLVNSVMHKSASSKHGDEIPWVEVEQYPSEAGIWVSDNQRGQNPDSQFYPDIVKAAVSENTMPSGAKEGITNSIINKGKVEESLLEIPFRAAPLSNRERLLLRKQALKMRKRPVLAVGRNNAISGVVKTIKTHFRKHPLAIVNIKGRAKGTSVQELIFELEQATGAVLVSREPNKIILYRGWDEGEMPGGTKGFNSSNGHEDNVSPQLLTAIRLECGLPT